MIETAPFPVYAGASADALLRLVGARAVRVRIGRAEVMVSLAFLRHVLTTRGRLGREIANVSVGDRRLDRRQGRTFRRRLGRLRQRCEERP